MKKWAAIFGVAALIAGILTFVVMVEVVVWIAQVLFVLFLIVALILAVGAFKVARRNR